jgi:hypothetical protein
LVWRIKDTVLPESNTPRSDLKGLVLATVNKLRAKLLDLTMAPIQRVRFFTAAVPNQEVGIVR